MKKNILIYDEQIMFANAIEFALSTKSDYTAISFNCAEKLKLELIENLKQFVVINSHNSNLNRVYDLLKDILLINKEALVLVISNITQIRFIKKLFEKGIKGYFDENSKLEEFIKSLDTISNDKMYICESTKEKMMNYISGNSEHENLKTDELTHRELDVLKEICDGLNGKEISEKLFISVNTVETHRRNIMFKLNVKNSLGLVKYAIQNEII